MKHTYVYRVEPLTGQDYPPGRVNYFSRSAAKHRVEVLAEHYGIKAKFIRSEPVEFIAPVVQLRSAS